MFLMTLVKSRSFCCYVLCEHFVRRLPYMWWFATGSRYGGFKVNETARFVLCMPPVCCQGCHEYFDELGGFVKCVLSRQHEFLLIRQR